MKKIKFFSWKPIRWSGETVKLYKLTNLILYVLENKADLKDFENDKIGFLDDEYKPKLEFCYSCFLMIKNLREKEILENSISQKQIKTKILKF